MSVGSSRQFNYPLSVWTATSFDGQPGWVPCGPYLTRTWNGGDSSRPYVLQTLAEPPSYQIVSKRRKDGSSYDTEVLVRPSRVRKRRVYSTAFRPPNAYSSVVDQKWQNIGRGYYGVHPYVPNGTWQLWRMPYMPPFPQNSAVWSDNDTIRLTNKLAEEINDSSFDPAIFLGTLHQSLNTIADRTKKLAKSIAYLRKGNLAKSLEAVTGHRRTSYTDKTAAQLMLEIQYGWRPLIHDVYEGATWLAAKLQKPMMHRVSRRLQRSMKLDTTGGGTALFRLFRDAELKVSKQIIGYLTEGKADTSLNLYSPANVAWELLPWSFVIDWFIPIGEYLESRGAASQMNGTFVTTEFRTVILSGWTPSPYGNNYSKFKSFLDLSGGSPYVKEFTMSRSISTSLATPTPSFKGLGKAASWEHCANAVALLLSSGKDKPDDVLRKIGNLKVNTKRFPAAYAHL
jgi:hypothetical protein